MISKILFTVFVVLMSMGSATLASTEMNPTKIKDADNKQIGEISINELASIIDSLVDQAVAERTEREPIIEIDTNELKQVPVSASHFYNGIEQPLSLPVHDMDAFRSANFLSKRGRPFQYFGARGKKASAFDFDGQAKRFNYMPSRG